LRYKICLLIPFLFFPIGTHWRSNLIKL